MFVCVCDVSRVTLRWFLLSSAGGCDLCSGLISAVGGFGSDGKQ